MRGTILILVATLLPSFASAQGWTEHTVHAEFHGAHSVYADDVDGDGDIDILGAAHVDNDITWWENIDGLGLIWSEHMINGDFVGARCVYAEDVDGDGDVDVLGAASTMGNISWWENIDGTGLSWVIHTINNSFNGARSVHAADMDDDGDIDILGAAYGANNILWWENIDGSGLNWSEHQVDDAFDGYSVYAEDVDGDGDMDVSGAGFDDDDIAWWENLDGIGLSWSEHSVDSDFDGAQSIFVCDVNGDGNLDILGTAYFADDVTWWENLDGSGTNWTEHTIAGGFDGATSIYAGDVDGDGDMDVMGAAAEANDITWWENLDGDGLNWSMHILDDEFDYTRSVYAEDIDSDGDLDILGVSFNAGEMTWWENPEPINVNPETEPVIVAVGGLFNYSVNISLLLDNPIFGSIWSEAILPNGSTYGPIYNLDFYFGTITEIRVEGLTQQIPFHAPLGDYEFVLNIGPNPFNSIYSDSFPFTVIDTPASGDSRNGSGWISYGQEQLLSAGSAAAADERVPSCFSLQQAFPNPFNPTTTVTVELPEAGQLHLVAYDVLGRQVAELANGRYGVGLHEFSFDGSELAGGVYFIRASVPGKVDLVQKVMLVK